MFPAARTAIGQPRDTDEWCFDNEKWGHEVVLAPFRIARAATTNSELAAFVDDGGYERREHWSDEGWQWRQKTGAQHPVYWKREGTRLAAATFRSMGPIAAAPGHHSRELVRGRGLLSLGQAPAAERKPSGRSRPLAPRSGNLGWRAMGVVDVGAHGEGDSIYGCRQMIGNVWEWTADRFAPYPGFEPDMYWQYSIPWFESHRTSRGGCWATQPRLARRLYRNYATPDRRDLLYGFRTCAFNS